MNFSYLSSNRKKVACQYALAGCVFFFLGYGLMLFQMRYLPATSETYIKLRAEHGTIMVFFGIVPVVFAALGYNIMPLIPGAPMYFPRLDRIALTFFYLSSALMLLSLFIPGSSAFILAMSLNIPFVIACSVNFIATIFHVFKAGTGWMQMRSIVWTLYATSLLVLFTYLLLEVAAVMPLADSFLGSNILPSTHHPINDEPLSLFWKHFFWFMGHPEVFVLFFPILGILADGLRLAFKSVTCKR